MAAGLLALAALNSSIDVASAQSSDQTKKEIAQVIDEIDRQQQLIDQLAEDHVAALDELTHVQADIVVAAARVAELEGKLGAVQTEVADFALETFVNGDQGGGVGALLSGAGDATVAVERSEYASLAVSAGSSAVDQMGATLHDLDKERALLDGQQRAATELISRVEAKRSATEKKTTDLHKFQVQKEAQLGEQLAAEQRRREAEQLKASQAAIAKAKAQAAADAAKRAATSARAESNVPARGAAVPGGAAPGSGNTSPTPPAASPRKSPPADPAPAADQSPADPGPAADQSPTSDPGADPAPADPAPVAAPEPAPQPDPQPAREIPAPSPGASGAVAAAMSQLGVPYQYATSNPNVSFDCSGLTAWAWGQAGVDLPHYSRAQFATLPHVSQGDIEPGDLIFSYNPISHVGMYIGNGQMVHAPHSGDVVKVSAVRWQNVTGIGRPG